MIMLALTNQKELFEFAAGWLFFSKIQKEPKLYFWGENNYYIYDMETQTAGPLQEYDDFANNGPGDDNWPDNNFPKRVDASFHLPKKASVDRPVAEFIFSGKYFERLWPGARWRYPYSGHHIVWENEPHGFPEQWQGTPEEFAERGLNGAYYDAASETAHFFSGDEFVVFDMKNKKEFPAQSDAQKITFGFEGL